MVHEADAIFDGGTRNERAAAGDVPIEIIFSAHPETNKPTIAWKGFVGGKKYGQWFLLESEPNAEDRRELKDFIVDSARRSIEAVRDAD